MPDAQLSQKTWQLANIMTVSVRDVIWAFTYQLGESILSTPAWLAIELFS